MIKAVAFPGTVIWDTRYLDSEDITGTLADQFKGAFAFLKRNLHHVQQGRGFNTAGELEIPEVVLEELLINALVHRDYFTSASIRIMVFSDRVEIISPGHLPDSLSVQDVLHGKTNQRNPTLTEHAFKVLPYRGLGSGIPRALEEWSRIELINEESGNQFTARVWRPKPEWETEDKSVTDPVTGQVDDALAPSRLESRLESQLAAKVLLLIEKSEYGKRELAHHLGHKTVSGELHKQIRRLLDLDLIEMTRPQIPNSRLQKYRLTEAGQQLLRQQQDASQL